MQSSHILQHFQLTHRIRLILKRLFNRTIKANKQSTWSSHVYTNIRVSSPSDPGYYARSLELTWCCLTVDQNGTTKSNQTQFYDGINHCWVNITICAVVFKYVIYTKNRKMFWNVSFNSIFVFNQKFTESEFTRITNWMNRIIVHLPFHFLLGRP